MSCSLSIYNVWWLEYAHLGKTVLKCLRITLPLVFRLFIYKCFFCCSVAKSCPTLRDPIDCLCPLNWWCHPTISSSVASFSSCPQSFPASRSFPMSQLFASGGKRIGASASVLPKSIQGWFRLRLSGCFPGDSHESSPALQFKSISSSALCFFYGPALTSVHDNWKSHSLDYYGPLSAEWCLCFLHLHKTCYTSWEIS